MKLTSRRLLIGLVSLLSAWCAGTAAHAAPARVIVHFLSAAQAESATTASAATSSTVPGPQRARRAGWLAARHGVALTDGRIIDGHRQVILGDGTLSAEQLAAKLRLDPAVAWAEPDRRRHAAAFPQTAPNDPLYPQNANADVVAGQWYLRAPTNLYLSAINALGAWPLATGNDVVVADIDTGVLFDHPDLQGKFFADSRGLSRYGYDFVSDITDNHDGDGVDSDAADPGDWSTYGECASGSAAERSSWHGTQTSSVIAANTNNGVGMAGVAPDAKLLPLRVLANCGGWDSDIMAAMLWAAGLPTGATQAVNQHPAKVLNLSLGGTGDCSDAYKSVIHDILAQKVVIVAAAGNGEGLAVQTPANCPGVIAVGGLRHTGTKVGFSNVGPEVALSAPGGNCVNPTGACIYPILTATNSGQSGAASYTYSSSSEPALGTSFSTPMVSGAAALMLEVNPALTPDQVKALLQSSARAFPTSASDVALCHAPNTVKQDECICTTATCGAGMLDVATAVAAASPTAVPVPAMTQSTSQVIVGATLTLDGSDSVAPTGRNVTGYAWTISGGHATVVGSTNASTLTLQADSTGFERVSLTVTDNLGAQATLVHWLAVNVSATPRAVISVPQTELLSSAALVANASASTSGSGAPLSYAWSILDPTTHNAATLSGSTSGNTVTVQASDTLRGVVPLALTVDDGLGHQGLSVVNLEVRAIHPAAALSTPSTTLWIGQTLTLDASQSTATAGRTIQSYTWRVLSGLDAGYLDGVTNGSTVQLKGRVPGKVRVEVTVTDNLGATDVRTVDIVVAQTNVTSAFARGSGGGGGAVAGAEMVALGLMLGVAAWRRRGATLS